MIDGIAASDRTHIILRYRQPAISGTYAKLLANQIRSRFVSDWGLSETGATGPTGNRYGDAAGHTCIGIAGAELAAITPETGKTDRLANMLSQARR